MFFVRREDGNNTMPDFPMQIGMVFFTYGRKRIGLGSLLVSSTEDKTKSKLDDRWRINLVINAPMH